MTAQEKALQLLDSFRVKIYDELGLDFNHDIVFRIAKQCALIAVDEILKSLEDYDDVTEKHLQSDFPELYSSQLQNMDWDFRYWQQVKTEIENL